MSTRENDQTRSAWRAALCGSLLSCGLVLCLPGSPAFAEDGTPTLGHDATATEYTGEIEAALEEYQRGHFEEARGLFQHAHKLAPSARTLRGLGMVEFELRHYVRASELLEASLLDVRKPLTDDQRAEVDKLLRRTRTFVARYTVSIEPASAEVTLELDGAQVDFDARHDLTVSIGEHTLTVRAPGYTMLERRLDATGGEVAKLPLVLSADRHTLPAPQAGGPAPSRVTHPYRPWGVVLASVGGLAIAAGTTLGVMALSRAKDAPTQDGPQSDQATRLAYVSDGVVALGAASAVTGLVLLLWRKRERPSSSRAMVIESLAPQLRVSF